MKEKIISQVLNESIIRNAMAMPRDIDFVKTYYHGTSTENAANSILKNGINPPDLTLKKINKLTPVKGKVYITTDLGYAIIYALGSNSLGDDMSNYSEVKSGKERYGYLFVVNGNELKDIQPDEDSVGEMLYQLTAGHSDAMLGTQKYNFNNINWLNDFAKRILTPKQYADIIQYADYGDLAVAGKKLIKNMNDSQKLAIIDAGAHIGHEGKINFKECWKIDKLDAIKLNKNGNNFFQIADRIK